MYYKRRRKRPKNRIEENLQNIKVLTHHSDEFFNRPNVKRVIKIAVVSGTVFGALYISKYFLNATAKMIDSYKNVRDAWRK